MPGKVLLVDDQPEVRELLAELLAGRGWEAVGFADGDRALAALGEGDGEVDLVVLDLDLGPGARDGLSVLGDLKARFADLPVVILTGKGTVDDAVRAMRLGATDFIAKDPRLGERFGLQMDKLDRMLAVLDDNERLREQNRLLRQRAGLDAELVGAEAGLRAVMDQVRALADIPRPVLILGERGTGKELVAGALHRLSRRAEGPFVTLNCAALTASLAEAELFGREKGAYTDAREARPGKFELADGGTLFLDEVGNMPPELQQKILRTIEYQRFERVGGSRSLQVDVRLVAATNADLQAEMEAGRFRRDLYDRLAFDTIVVPPLRLRREDIPALCRAFIERFRHEVSGVRCREISDAALARISALELPGNVRELRNLVERAAYRCRGERIEVEDLNLSEPRPHEQSADFHSAVAAYEQRLLVSALEGRSLADAARALGLGYDQLRRLVKKHGIAR
ncbi:MAG: sigma-54-dependent Fis family transcriptional regulator [Deltaproteobacteria bacterium]|nr:sigma-54-dependent Fis family transcriptional regulator [Deltaproteobacteria bacterium]